MDRIVLEQKRKKIADYYYTGGYSIGYKLVQIICLVSPHYPLDVQQQMAFQYLIKWNEDGEIISKIKQAVEIPSEIKNYLHSMAICMEKSREFPRQQLPQYDMSSLFEGMKDCGIKASLAYNERLKDTEHFSECVKLLETYIGDILAIEGI